MNEFEKSSPSSSTSSPSSPSSSSITINNTKDNRNLVFLSINILKYK